MYVDDNSALPREIVKGLTALEPAAVVAAAEVRCQPFSLCQNRYIHGFPCLDPDDA